MNANASKRLRQIKKTPRQKSVLEFSKQRIISMHLVLVIRCAIIAPTGQHSVSRGNTPGIANDKNISPQWRHLYLNHYHKCWCI